MTDGVLKFNKMRLFVVKPTDAKCFS